MNTEDEDGQTNPVTSKENNNKKKGYGTQRASGQFAEVYIFNQHLSKYKYRVDSVSADMEH